MSPTPVRAFRGPGPLGPVGPPVNRPAGHHYVIPKSKTLFYSFHKDDFFLMKFKVHCEKKRQISKRKRKENEKTRITTVNLNFKFKYLINNRKI